MSRGKHNHFGQCPKGKAECRVPGCGEKKFVRVLELFKLKPERLNSNNSQVLFERPGESGDPF